MNKTIIGLFVGLALGIGGTWFFQRSSTTKAESPAATTAAKADEKPNPLRVPPAKRGQSGIVLAKPTAPTLTPEVQGYGRTLDATSLATVVAETETARTALEASEKELARTKKLFAAGGNASAQAVEAAQAAAGRDHAALNSAQARLSTTWGRDVAQNAAEISAALAQGATLARIDMLPGEATAPNPKQAKINLPGRTEEFTADVIGPAPVADPQVQGTSFLVLVRQPTLSIGAAFRATLPGAGEAGHPLVLPRSAIVYHQGSAWIFVLGEEDTFERKFVTIGRSVGPDAVSIATGVEAEDQVVTTGAQQLLAAELQAGGSAEEP